MNVKVKMNVENDELYCDFCKQKISLSEKYVLVEQESLGEKYFETRHLDCLDNEDEEDDQFFGRT